MTWLKQHRTLLLCLTAVLLTAFLWNADHHFTPERWASLDDWSRGKLVNSLLDQYDGLVGLQESEVLTLLGPDTDGDQSAATLLPGGGTETRSLLVYPIGGRPWTMFPEFLMIYLDHGQVTETQIMAD